MAHSWHVLSRIAESPDHQHIQPVAETPHRTLLPRSRRPSTPDRAESSSLGKVQRQTAFPPPSSVCHTFIGLHLRMEPLFFPRRFTCRHAARPTYAFGHGWASECAFVRLRHRPHNRPTNCPPILLPGAVPENRGLPPPWPPLNGHSLRRITRRPRSSPRARPFTFQSNFSIAAAGNG